MESGKAPDGEAAPGNLAIDWVKTDQKSDGNEVFDDVVVLIRIRYKFVDMAPPPASRQYDPTSAGSGRRPGGGIPL